MTTMIDLGAPYAKPIWVFCWLQDGCAACHEALPHIRALKKKYPLRVMIVERFLNRSDTKVPGIEWLPASTPAYGLVDQDGGEKRLLKRHVGAMSLEQLERWIGQDHLA